VPAHLKFSYLGQKGDTIIEVLIAMAVAASVLAVSYGTMNRNMLIIQDNQERTEASKLAQGQLEALRRVLVLPAVNTSFCIDSTGLIQTLPAGVPNASLAADDFTKYTGQCTVNGLYRIVLTSSDQKNYYISVRWDRIVNNERDAIAMVYRL
jgi:prepilin-type N-terminal cleavage/methylation domain-containing protein